MTVHIIDDADGSICNQRLASFQPYDVGQKLALFFVEGPQGALVVGVEGPYALGQQVSAQSVIIQAIEAGKLPEGGYSIGEELASYQALGSRGYEIPTIVGWCWEYDPNASFVYIMPRLDAQILERAGHAAHEKSAAAQNRAARQYYARNVFANLDV